MLEVRNIQTYYGNIQALKNVSLTINEGEIVTLIGANGAGKSTTLMSICGVTPPRHGEILFRGEPIQKLSAEKIVTLGICQVPEGRHIFPQMSVLENLEMGAYMRHDKAGIKADIEYVFGRFPILEKRRQQAGGTLSGGERRMHPARSATGHQAFRRRLRRAPSQAISMASIASAVSPSVGTAADNHNAGLRPSSRVTHELKGVNRKMPTQPVAANSPATVVETSAPFNCSNNQGATMK